METKDPRPLVPYVSPDEAAVQADVCLAVSTAWAVVAAGSFAMSVSMLLAACALLAFRPISMWEPLACVMTLGSVVFLLILVPIGVRGACKHRDFARTWTIVNRLVLVDSSKLTDRARMGYGIWMAQLPRYDTTKRWVRQLLSLNTD